MPLQVLLSSIGLVFLTELGDKTMITAMCLSAQYRRPWIVLLATMIALATSTLIAVIIGVILSTSIPVESIIYISGFLFLDLGIYTLSRRNNDAPDEYKSSMIRTSNFPSLVIESFIWEHPINA